MMRGPGDLLLVVDAPVPLLLKATAVLKDVYLGHIL
jgi:hypothetical protein